MAASTAGDTTCFPVPPPPLPEFYASKQESAVSSSSSRSSSSSSPRSSNGGRASPSQAIVTAKKATFILPPAKLESSSSSNESVSNNAYALPPPMTKEAAIVEPRMNHHYSHQSHLSHHSRTRRRSKSVSTPSQPKAPVIVVPPLPPGYEHYAPQFATLPMATYHICRVCLRPRSERFHRENLNLPNEVPPPPGICRRCRVTRVEDRLETAKPTRVSASEPVRLGIECLVPESAILTQDEVRDEIAKNRESARRERRRRDVSSASEASGREKVVYRYITVDKVPGHLAVEKPAEVSVENLAAMDTMNDQLSRKAERRPSTTRDSLRVQPTAKEAVKSSIVVARQSMRAGEVANVDSADASISAPISRTSITDTKSAKRAAVPQVGYTESEIRRFARDEIERYRQAERLLESHPDPFAHGRMIPAQRRIVSQDEEVLAKPWKVTAADPGMTPGLAQSSKEARRHQASVPKERMRDQVQSNRSKGSYLRAEHVAEYPDATLGHESHQATSPTAYREPKSDRILREVTYVREGRGRPLPTESDPPVSVKLREVLGYVQTADRRSKPPSTSSRPVGQSTVVKEVIEVIEQIGLPPLPPLEGRETAPTRATNGSDPPSRPHQSSPSLPPLEARRSDAGSWRSERIEANGIRPSQSEHDRPIASQRSSSRTDRDYWEDDGVILTTGHLSNMTQGQPSTRSWRQTGDERRVQRGNGSSSGASMRSLPSKTTPVKEQGPGTSLAMPSPRQYLGSTQSRRLSTDDKDFRYASWVQGVDVRRAEAEPPRAIIRRSDSNKDDHDDKTVHPAKLSGHGAPALPRTGREASRRPTHEGVEWEYRERIIQPTDRPLGKRPFEEAPVRHSVESTQYYTHNSAPSAALRSSLRTEQQSERSGSAPRSPRLHESKALDHNIISRTSTAYSTSPTLARGREKHKRTSEESAHVRFASKVEFSPTPPASEDYPPSGDRATDRRGVRRVERRESLPLIDESLALDVFEKQPRSRPREGVLESTEGGERVDNRADSGKQERYRDDASRFGTNPSARKSALLSANETETDTTTQLSRQRPIARGLSESPSRERLRLEMERSRGGNREREKQMPDSPRRGRSWEAGRDRNLDGRGPYREDILTESLDTHWGSGHGDPVLRRCREI